MNPQAVAIIPARGGSKGIPHKNIVSIGGKPLIAWTIQAAQNCPTIKHILVSSDDEEILAVARSFGAATLKRPAELAADTTRAEPVLTHALEYMQQQEMLPELVVYLQPTSPLRTADHLNRAFSLFADKNVGALVSVHPIDNKVLKAYVLDDNGFLTGIRNNGYPNFNRQDLPQVYMSNGAIYIFRSKEFLTHQSFFVEKTIPFVMTPEESIDIDFVEDIVMVDRILRDKTGQVAS